MPSHLLRILQDRSKKNQIITQGLLSEKTVKFLLSYEETVRSGELSPYLENLCEMKEISENKRETFLREKYKKYKQRALSDRQVIQFIEENLYQVVASSPVRRTRKRNVTMEERRRIQACNVSRKTHL
eukprot:TRINITY_DN1566_c0_g1_i1.p1 TRINITY_DN1566_c0_g1~~TRINITY_DN1566_c0_g1_i1.p1  ORF type:complete len:128 (-),score=19.06 TRINITY_DN1566_c0_g1_i1:54-437(-)